jgi:LysM repeat protein
MQPKALAAVIITALFAAGFGSIGHAKALSRTTTASHPDTVKVVHGDTLSSIAGKHQTTYVRLFDANSNISNPNVIFPGQVIRIPAATEQLPDRLHPAPAVTKPRAQTASAPVAASRPAPAPAPRPQVRNTVAAPAVSAPSSGVWASIAQCESGGNWAANTGNGFYGGLQFTLSSWHAVGGAGYPNQASASEQIARAKILQARQGWGAWPVCAAKIGLR